MHALIIEDEDLVAIAIEDVLRECGFTSFDVAPSALTAIDAASHRKPDLITADVRLEPGCGIAAVEAICKGPSVPVVFITANAAEVTRRLPKHRMVAKPFSDRALIAAVASAMLDVAGPDVTDLAKFGVRFGSPSISNAPIGKRRFPGQK